MEKQKRYHKNQVLSLFIEDLGNDGEGIGKDDGFPIFVKDALIGDFIEASITKEKKGYAYGHLVRILKPSPDRVQPLCPVHQQCGGCQLQALSYEKQLQYKEKKVKNALIRIGKIDEALIEACAEPIVQMAEPYFYRNKTIYPVGTTATGGNGATVGETRPTIIAGFYAQHSHRIVTHDTCYLGDRLNAEILSILTQYFQRHHLTAYDETSAQGFFRYILLRSVPAKDGHIERMVCLILNEKLFSKGRLVYHLPNEEELIKALSAIEGMKSISLCENREPGNNMMGDQVKVIWGSETLRAFIGLPNSLEFILSPSSFLQVNTIQMQNLYQAILTYASLTKEDTVIDLYCGIGTISLFLAQAAKWVYGIELNPQAIENAKQNAALNTITNTSFYAGKVEEILPTLYQEKDLHPDVIVLDPPRKGCEESVLQTIIEMNPKKIVYVSCDPATLARDVRFLTDGGYHIQRYRPIDMFPQTVHVECVILLTKV